MSNLRGRILRYCFYTPRLCIIRRITVLHLADRFGSLSLGQTFPVHTTLSQWHPSCHSDTRAPAAVSQWTSHVTSNDYKILLQIIPWLRVILKGVCSILYTAQQWSDFGEEVAGYNMHRISKWPYTFTPKWTPLSSAPSEWYRFKMCLYMSPFN